jgi:hypothetical protein
MRMCDARRALHCLAYVIVAGRNPAPYFFFSGVQCESSVHDSGWPRSPRKDITASECNALPTFDFVVP